MTRPVITVSELGERALIDRIVALLPGPPAGEVWSGDDAAVLNLRGPKVVFTCDALVEEVDFRVGPGVGHSIGWKAVAVNASDVSAMGARPRAAVVTLALPGATPVDLVDEIARGCGYAAERFDIGIVGGDISEASEISISVAMIGELGSAPVLRSGARPGDAICITGALGGAAAGLVCARLGIEDAALIRRQQAPEPRLAEGLALADLGATAMLDVSDGLAVDLQNLCAASWVGCEIDSNAIPIDEALAARADELGVDPQELAILGGEDLELLFTIGADLVPDDLPSADGDRTVVTRIGSVTQEGTRLGDGPLSSWARRGWEHLRHG